MHDFLGTITYKNYATSTEYFDRKILQTAQGTISLEDGKNGK